MRLALEEIELGSAAGDERRMCRGWKLFLILPRMLLHRPARGGLVPKSRLLARITSFAREDWEELLIAGRDCSEVAAQFRSRRRRTHAPTIDQRADRAEHMATTSGVRVHVRQCLRDMGDALAARFGGQSELERRRCQLDGVFQLLGQRARHQSSDKITHHTIPRTPPVGFCNAIILPTLKTCNTSSGMSARANLSHTRQNFSASRSESNNGRRCSAVIPDGPPAAPGRAHRMFLNKRSCSNSSRPAGWWSCTSRSNGSRGAGGRFRGSCNACKAASFPGAMGSPSKAMRVADSSRAAP